MSLQVTVTSKALWETRAFDVLIFGNVWNPPKRILAVKIVRQITGEDLATVVRSQRAYIEHHEQEAQIAELRAKLMA